MELDKILLSTVVGSFPSSPSREEYMKSYHENKDPYVKSVQEAVDIQVQAGIELVTDGQVRGDMIEFFAENLRGFRVKERVEIISEIDHSKPITVKDAEITKELIPDNCGVKGVITGPWTLIKGSENKYYDSEKDAVMEAAEALNKEAELLSEICDVIQLDEPFFSVEYPEYGKESVKKVLDVGCTTALHACGDVSSIVDKLIEMDVDILDHEFAAHPDLYSVYEGLDIDKKIGAGVVTTDPKKESVEEIKENIDRAYGTFGPKTMIDPDCGLRNLEKNIAKEKLDNMVVARNVVLNEKNREDRG